ncbi:MAG TPA: nucleotidyltransferase family protein, partial [Candidatus Saccharimonadales bacterium]|nr:nucleotidyltransferase family protein [Candidatus Saccharimonadales bacterium]
MTAVNPDAAPARTHPSDVLPEDRLLWEFWLNHGLVADALRERLDALPLGANGAYLAGNALYGGFERKLLDALSSSAGLDPAVLAAVAEALAPPAAKVTLEDPEGRLLALLALWPPPGGDLARRAREEAVRVSRWWDFARAAGRTNLLAAVATGIASAGIEEAVPAPVLGFLQAAAEGIRRRNERLLPFVEKVTRELSGAGIRHCLLKESALLREIYPEPRERLVGDVDLLMPPEDIERTEAVLRALDHRPFVGIWSSTWYRSHHHHVAPLVNRDAATKVEPHIGIWIPGESVISIADEILATSRPHRGFEAGRPDATMLCFHLLADLHGGASAGKLGQAADLMRLLRAEGREVDMGRLTALADRTGCRPYIEDSVAMVARVFGRDLLDERAPGLL